VGRTKPRVDLKSLLEGGAERLTKGTSIIIFPQTTGTATLDPRELNIIGVKLAKWASVLVVPIALTTDGWDIAGSAGTSGKSIPPRHPTSRSVHHSGSPTGTPRSTSISSAIFRPTAPRWEGRSRDGVLALKPRILTHRGHTQGHSGWPLTRSVLAPHDKDQGFDVFATALIRINRTEVGGVSRPRPRLSH
jgi:hypothetical protein